MTAPSRRGRGLLVTMLALGVVTAGVGMALALTPIGSRDFAFIATSGNALYSPISPFWLSWSHPIGLTLLATGAGTTGAIAVALLLTRNPKRPAGAPTENMR